jgi:Ni/Co efflux regulator RcnB
MRQVLSLLTLLLLILAVPSVYATPNTTTTEEEEAAPAEQETAQQPEEQSTQTEEEAEPTTEGTTDSITTLSKAEENAEEAITSNNDINPCLLDPSLPECPKPGPNQDCPEGWAQNEDGNCFPLHPEGCPSGYHGHEDDETGRCIPNSTPCDPSYILVTGENNRKNCERKESYCQTHEDDNRCKDDDNDNDNGNGNNNNNKKVIIIKHIKNVDIVNKINDADSNGDDIDVSQTIVAINYDEGAGINCVFDEDDNGACETFDVNKDSGKEPLLKIIDFD